jgi:hypothetical protein
MSQDKEIIVNALNGAFEESPKLVRVATVSAAVTCQRDQPIPVFPCGCGAMNAAACKAMEVSADGYIAIVPDKCDRIVWKGRYYHLPIETSPIDHAAIAALTVSADMLSALRDYTQQDETGMWCGVSLQALQEAIAILEKLPSPDRCVPPK